MFAEIIGFTMGFFGFVVAFFGFSTVLFGFQWFSLVPSTRPYGFFLFLLVLQWFGLTLDRLDWFYNGFLASGLVFHWFCNDLDPQSSSSIP